MCTSVELQLTPVAQPYLFSFFILSPVPSDKQTLLVYTVLRYLHPGSFAAHARTLFCNICVSHNVFCRTIDWYLLMVCNKHNTHFTAFNAYLCHHPLPSSITNVDAAFSIGSLKHSKSVTDRGKMQGRTFWWNIWQMKTSSRLTGIIWGCSFSLPIRQGIR